MLLAHPGGPFWSRKDLGSWSIPKGEYSADEDALTAARREFVEELGFDLPGECRSLGEVKQQGGKIVTAFALQGDLDPNAIVSGTFEMEWPPRSGSRQRFPEVDRAAWFDLDGARRKINPAQSAFLDRLRALVPAKP